MFAKSRVATPNPESFQLAHRRIERDVPWTPVTESANLNRQANARRQNSTSSVESSAQDEGVSSNFRIFIKWEDSIESRGAFNVLERLIEEQGLETIQQRGIAIQDDDIQNQAIVFAATTYGIPAIPSIAPERHPPLHDTISGMNSVANGVNAYMTEGITTNTVDPKGPFPVTAKNNLDNILGLGTPALELVQQVDMLLKEEGHILSNGHKHYLNAVISPAGEGDTLSGVAAALAETGVYVFGADSLTNSERAAQTWYSSQGEETRLDPPAGPFAWSIFTSGKCLLGVFNASDSEVRAAQRFMREQENVILTVREAAPLAILLFNDEFKHLIATHSNKVGGWNIGVILNRRTNEAMA